MTLSLYLVRRFLFSLAMVGAVFVGLVFLIDLVEQVRRLAGREAGFAEAVHLAALHTPETIYQMLPLIIIIASVTLFLGLARSSELVVIRAAGRSGLRILMAPALATLALGAVLLAVFNPLVAATSKQFEYLSDRYRHGEASVVSVSREGLWLRQGGEQGQVVINAARAGPEGTELYDVTFLTFSAETGPVRRIAARSAALRDGAWHLSNAKEWQLSAPNPERSAVEHAQLSLPTDLTPAQIRDSFGSPASIAIWNLPGFIDSLERAGFSARAHLVWLHMELTMPLLLTSMVMVGAGFAMRQPRAGRTAVMVLSALLAGLALAFLRNFAQVLGENGQIPAMLAAWIPPVAGILFALGLMLHMEDG
ncbi:LPS export ABC transporter permease LptG [Rhodobacteraceae bacterium WD3A24]|nr:LPS export ABC transporter permease LptG [Rhodobacteraceae bacterium WD3A24]